MLKTLKYSCYASSMIGFLIIVSSFFAPEFPKNSIIEKIGKASPFGASLLALGLILALQYEKLKKAKS